MTDQAVLYARFSPRPKGAEVESNDNQVERMQRYCELAGLEVIEVVTDEYVSGSLPLADRPGGRVLLDLVDGNRGLHVVIQKVDRLFRNYPEAGRTVDVWSACGVTLHLADQGGCSIDTGTATGYLMFGQLALFADFERRVIGERTQQAMRRYVRTGRRVSAEPPYGWRVAEDDKLVRDIAEQAAVDRMVELKGEGTGLRAIARQLEAEGYESRNGGWHHNTVSRILDRCLGDDR
jgi:putative DNA-invertase from lambdoid prophage Rac